MQCVFSTYCLGFTMHSIAIRNTVRHHFGPLILISNFCATLPTLHQRFICSRVISFMDLSQEFSHTSMCISSNRPLPNYNQQNTNVLYALTHVGPQCVCACVRVCVRSPRPPEARLGAAFFFVRLFFLRE